MTDLDIAVSWGVFLLAVAVVVSGAMQLWRGLHQDWLSPLQLYRHGWWVQHDEKHFVHEGRVLATRPAGERAAHMSDYYWPVITAVGVVGPLMVAAGWRRWGISQASLRKPFFLVNTAAVLVFALCLASLHWALALPFLLIFLVNAETLTNWRAALPEAFLSLYLGGLTLLLIQGPDILWTYLPLAAFIGGLLSCIKVHHPVIAAAYIAALVIVQAIHSWTLPWEMAVLCALSWGMGLALSEAGQALILKRLGIDPGMRWHNLTASLRQHRDDQGAIRVKQKPHPPSKLDCFRFLGIEMNAHYAGVIPVLFLAVAFLVGLGVGREDPASALTHPALWTVLLFLGLHQLAHYPVYWYPKRAVSLYPLLVVAAGLALDQVLAETAAGFGLWAGLGLSGLGVVALLLSFWLWQYKVVRHQCKFRSTAVDDNRALLESWVPAGSTLYADCFCARFLWPKDYRIIAGDVVLMSGQDVLDWAEINDASFVLLSSLEGVQVDNRRWRVSLELPFDDVSVVEAFTAVLLERARPVLDEPDGVPFTGDYDQIDAYRLGKR